MSIIKEFEEFAMRGSAIDMAVGIIFGAAFGKVVSSLVSDVIMPPLGLLLGEVDFSNLAFTLKHATLDNPAVTLRYGKFISSIMDFFIVTSSVFLMIKALNTLKRRQA